MTPVALVIGAGPRIGTSVAKKFASIGYKVAIVSRNGTGSKTTDGLLSLKADVSAPEQIPNIFSKVTAEFDAPPSVVVYNAAARSVPPVENELFSIASETIATDFNINTTSAFVAAQQAVKGWEQLPADAKKSFIYTGNMMNLTPVPWAATITLGMGKSASSFWIHLADMLHHEKGYRFFYADERNVDGSMKGMSIDGEAHAEFFAQLAAHEGNVPWHATFTKEKGYVNFGQ